MTSSAQPSRPARNLSAPIAHDLDLLDVWETIAPVNILSRTLLLLVVDADCVPAPQLTEIESLPDDFDPGTGAAALEQLADLCAWLLADVVPGGTVALAIARPGPRLFSRADRRWSVAVVDALAERGVAMRTLHLVTPGWVRPVTLDDVLGG